MGKKSRRNKKTGNDAASATATASAANIASSGTTGNQCFHGSTADKFQPNSEYMKAVKEYLDMRFRRSGSQVQQEMSIQMGLKYDEDHMHLMKDPGFYRFIFALCTKKYLDGCDFKPDGRKRQTIVYLLLLGLTYRYRTTPEKLAKYVRDIGTERGMIKVLVRETKTYCPCMKEGKGIAKAMDKVGKCHGCKKEFPKATLSFCSGCQLMKYHNRECQINHWQLHKSECKKLGSSAKV